MPRRLALLLGLLVVVSAAPFVSAEDPAERYIVGYEPGQGAGAALAVRAAGGSVEKESTELAFLVVTTNDPDTFQRLVELNPAIAYVEKDDPTRLAGAQWNGAQWNGAQWNGAQWNGAQWNGAQWNGAQWNGAQWNGAQWNGAQRNAFNSTVYSFYSHGAPSWKYDLASTDPGLLWQWGIFATDTHYAWSQTKGTRAASLCVLDSGVSSGHPDIAPNYEAGVNVVSSTASAEDDAGHGTHIAGIAAAAVGNAYGVAGVGNTRILSAKVLDSNGNGYERDLAIGLAWCASQEADVGVMALSATDDGPTMDRALQYASDHDVLLLASAGNDGAAVSYPARDPRVVAVSAITAKDQLASFSNRGPEIDLAAPGIDILGPMLDDSFAFGSGTSQAVAFAAGAAALVRDADSTLTADQAREILLDTADDIGTTGTDPATGRGRIRMEGTGFLRFDRSEPVRP